MLKEGKITSTAAKLIGTADKGLGIETEFENLGTTFLSAAGTAEIINSKGETIASIDISKFKTLPGYKRRLYLEYKQALPADDYVVIIVLDFGGDYLAGAQVEIKV